MKIIEHFPILNTFIGDGRQFEIVLLYLLISNDFGILSKTSQKMF